MTPERRVEIKRYLSGDYASYSWDSWVDIVEELLEALDEAEQAQRERSAAIILQDCRDNWMKSATPQGCAHTILAEAVLKNRVPERPTLPHQ